MELMNDPVMVATGHTYDRVCIERWLQQGNRTCPVTGMRLRHLELTPNFALRNAIQVELHSCCNACFRIVARVCCDTRHFCHVASVCCAHAVTIVKVLQFRKLCMQSDAVALLRTERSWLFT